MRRTRTAIIIGGGVIGVTSAYSLARDGWQVTVIDTHDEVARATSRGNGRQLSYAYASALGSPSLLAQIPGLLLGRNPAFRMSVTGPRGYHRWLAQMLGQCTKRASSTNTRALLELAQRSREAMAALLEAHAIQFSRKPAGKLVMLGTEADVIAARNICAFKRTAGAAVELVDADTARAIEPALAAAGDPLIGALYMPGDESGDCAEFARALMDVCSREYGAKFRGGASARRVERGRAQTRVVLQGGEVLAADLVVIAAAHGAPALAAPLGHRLPIQPMKGYSFTAPLGPAAPRTAISDLPRRLVFTHCGDRMLVAGIAELGRVDTRVDRARLGAMIAVARQSLPDAALYDEADEGWAGLRPVTPNSQPVTRLLEPGIAVNAGHGMLGWTLAMGSAEQLAEAVLADG